MSNNHKAILFDIIDTYVVDRDVALWKLYTFMPKMVERVLWWRGFTINNSILYSIKDISSDVFLHLVDVLDNKIDFSLDNHKIVSYLYNSAYYSVRKQLKYNSFCETPLNSMWVAKLLKVKKRGWSCIIYDWDWTWWETDISCIETCNPIEKILNDIDFQYMLYNLCLWLTLDQKKVLVYRFVERQKIVDIAKIMWKNRKNISKIMKEVVLHVKKVLHEKDYCD